MSGLTAKPDRPCFYLKTTLLRRSRRRREEGVSRLSLSLEGILLAVESAVGGADTTAAAAASAAASVACVARGCRKGR